MCIIVGMYLYMDYYIDITWMWKYQQLTRLFLYIYVEFCAILLSPLGP